MLIFSARTIYPLFLLKLNSIHPEHSVYVSFLPGKIKKSFFTLIFPQDCPCHLKYHDMTKHYIKYEYICESVFFSDDKLLEVKAHVYIKILGFVQCLITQ